MMGYSRTITVSIGEMIKKKDEMVDEFMFGYIQEKAMEHGVDVDICLDKEKIVEAMRKQIPFKPERVAYWEGKCKCGVVFMDRETNYCGNCGQKLDWSEEE